MLHCMSPVLAQSGHTEMYAICPWRHLEQLASGTRDRWVGLSQRSPRDL